MNTFGRILRLHIFGESHGQGVGAVVDGVPPGLPLDLAEVQAALDRRRPGQSRYTTQRQEADRVQVLAGELDGHCTGAPLALWIANEDARSSDYGRLREVPRPGHADWTAHVRSGGWNDHRGGGHFSGRLTAPLVAAGAVAQLVLRAHGITVGAHLHQVADLAGETGAHDVAAIRRAVDTNPMRTAHAELVDCFTERVDTARKAGDSLGGTVEFIAEGMPVGAGEPWTQSVESHLAQLLFAIPAVKGVSFGAGFGAVTMLGSQHNDPFEPGDDGRPQPVTNHAGGILGGLTTGAPVWGHVAIKPTSSIFVPQQSVSLVTGEAATLELKGRHDPIIAVRAVAAVEAAVAFALADLHLSYLAAQAAQATFGDRPPN